MDCRAALAMTNQIAVIAQATVIARSVSDVAIHEVRGLGLPRCARNDGDGARNDGTGARNDDTWQQISLATLFEIEQSEPFRDVCKRKIKTKKSHPFNER